MYLSPISYNALGNTGIFDQLTEVSLPFQLFIDETKFLSQQHNLFLEYRLSYYNVCLLVGLRFYYVFIAWSNLYSQTFVLFGGGRRSLEWNVTVLYSDHSSIGV